MRKLLPLMLALSLAVAACKEPPPPEPAKGQAPPEPTPAEIKGELRNSIQVLSGAATSPAPLDPAIKDQAVASFNGVKAKHAAKANGQTALQEFSRDVEQLVNTAKGSESWMVVKGGCEIYRSLNPGSDRFKQLEGKADVMLARPQVEVTGFFQSNGATDIFLKVTDFQVEKPVETYTVREGEEFHEKAVEGPKKPVLKVVRIIGANQAVELEYLPIHDTWTIQGPQQF
ncbi:MAG: hypothetical protein HYV26_12145 [Candidatus Hydrogenedentes bacterium]|nr:hypothetical protein [Candidatus Hydrogenedentota bacterium]MBI3119016.1 hypothetical protein [Candidatus Hydrogenedentota bacterium]